MIHLNRWQRIGIVISLIWILGSVIYVRIFQVETGGVLFDFALRTCNELTHAAGFGSKTDGFRNLLDLYQELHNIGYRCDIHIGDFLKILKGKLAN